MWHYRDLSGEVSYSGDITRYFNSKTQADSGVTWRSDVSPPGLWLTLIIFN